MHLSQTQHKIVSNIYIEVVGFFRFSESFFIKAAILDKWIKNEYTKLNCYGNVCTGTTTG